jgi:hypothetical protein
MQVECPITGAWENWTQRIFKQLTFASETKFGESRRFGNMRPGLNPFSFSSPHFFVQRSQHPALPGESLCRIIV